jgi:hypothetical protein
MCPSGAIRLPVCWLSCQWVSTVNNPTQPVVPEHILHLHHHHHHQKVNSSRYDIQYSRKMLILAFTTTNRSPNRFVRITFFILELSLFVSWAIFSRTKNYINWYHILEYPFLRKIETMSTKIMKNTLNMALKCKIIYVKMPENIFNWVSTEIYHGILRDD